MSLGVNVTRLEQISAALDDKVDELSEMLRQHQQQQQQQQQHSATTTNATAGNVTIRLASAPLPNGTETRPSPVTAQGAPVVREEAPSATFTNNASSERVSMLEVGSEAANVTAIPANAPAASGSVGAVSYNSGDDDASSNQPVASLSVVDGPSNHVGLSERSVTLSSAAVADAASAPVASGALFSLTPSPSAIEAALAEHAAGMLLAGVDTDPEPHSLLASDPDSLVGAPQYSAHRLREAMSALPIASAAAAFSPPSSQSAASSHLAGAAAAAAAAAATPLVAAPLATAAGQPPHVGGTFPGLHRSAAPDAPPSSSSTLSSFGSGGAAGVFKMLTKKLKDLEIDQSVVHSHIADMATTYSAAVVGLQGAVEATRSELTQLKGNLTAVTVAQGAVLESLARSMLELREVMVLLHTQHVGLVERMAAQARAFEQQQQQLALALGGRLLEHHPHAQPPLPAPWPLVGDDAAAATATSSVDAAAARGASGAADFSAAAVAHGQVDHVNVTVSKASAYVDATEGDEPEDEGDDDSSSDEEEGEHLLLSFAEAEFLVVEEVRQAIIATDDTDMAIFRFAEEARAALLSPFITGGGFSGGGGFGGAGSAATPRRRRRRRTLAGDGVSTHGGTPPDVPSADGGVCADGASGSERPAGGGCRVGGELEEGEEEGEDVGSPRPFQYRTSVAVAQWVSLFGSAGPRLPPPNAPFWERAASTAAADDDGGGDDVEADASGDGDEGEEGGAAAGADGVPVVRSHGEGDGAPASTASTTAAAPTLPAPPASSRGVGPSVALIDDDAAAAGVAAALAELRLAAAASQAALAALAAQHTALTRQLVAVCAAAGGALAVTLVLLATLLCRSRRALLTVAAGAAGEGGGDECGTAEVPTTMVTPRAPLSARGTRAKQGGGQLAAGSGGAGATGGGGGAW